MGGGGVGGWCRQRRWRHRWSSVATATAYSDSGSDRGSDCTRGHGTMVRPTNHDELECTCICKNLPYLKRVVQRSVHGEDRHCHKAPRADAPVHPSGVGHPGRRGEGGAAGSGEERRGHAHVLRGLTGHDTVWHGGVCVQSSTRRGGEWVWRHEAEQLGWVSWRLVDSPCTRCRAPRGTYAVPCT